VVPPDKLAETVEAEIARFTAQSAAVLGLTKRAVREAAGIPFEIALSRLEDLYQLALLATVDAHEGLKAYAEKRKPVWLNR
jgi:enoyl-CoA hydratase/carnithine racemase